MNKRMLVREVHLKQGCLSRRDNPDVVPTLVCPLCVLEGHSATERTATLAITGHIWCNKGCGRYSSIVINTMFDRDVSLYPCNLTTTRSLTQQTEALGLLRPALAGSGEISNIIAADEEHPDAVVGFGLPRIRIDERALAEIAFG